MEGMERTRSACEQWKLRCKSRMVTAPASSTHECGRRRGAARAPLDAVLRRRCERVAARLALWRMPVCRARWQVRLASWRWTCRAPCSTWPPPAPPARVRRLPRGTRAGRKVEPRRRRRRSDADDGGGHAAQKVGGGGEEGGEEAVEEGEHQAQDVRPVDVLVGDEGEAAVGKLARGGGVVRDRGVEAEDGHQVHELGVGERRRGRRVKDVERLAAEGEDAIRGAADDGEAGDHHRLGRVPLGDKESARRRALARGGADVERALVLGDVAPQLAARLEQRLDGARVDALLLGRQRLAQPAACPACGAATRRRREKPHRERRVSSTSRPRRKEGAVRAETATRRRPAPVRGCAPACRGGRRRGRRRGGRARRREGAPRRADVDAHAVTGGSRRR